MTRGYATQEPRHDVGDVDDSITVRVRNALANLPITINTNYGDAFQPSQWNDTLSKLSALQESGYSGEVHVGSKYTLSDLQLTELYDVNPNLWVFCGINGLSTPTRFNQAEYFENYLRVSDVFPRTVCTLRPIIPRRNDDMRMLAPIVELVSRGRRLLHHGGYRDPAVEGSRKYEYPELLSELTAFCDESNVRLFGRCSCLVASVTGRACVPHSTNQARNLDVLAALGYDFTHSSGVTKLQGFLGNPTVTKGDVAFASHITASAQVKGEGASASEVMSLKAEDGAPLVCTSSWFSWSRQVPCELSCDYCFAAPESAVRIPYPKFGTHPLRLFESLREALTRTYSATRAVGTQCAAR